MTAAPAGGTALVVVDVQNDFCEGGSLAVTGGVAVAAGITAHLAAERDRYDLVVVSQDWHEPGSDNEGHIALPPAVPDYRGSWPPHCLAGTPGAELHPALTIPGPWRWVRKGYGTAAYSAFEGRDADARGLADLLHEAAVERVVVCGIATDHCVDATARDAVAAGFTVELLVDLTAAVDATGRDAVVDALTAQGVRAR